MGYLHGASKIFMCIILTAPSSYCILKFEQYIINDWPEIHNV